ncbi:MAG: recombinase family protein, partial [bacterium]|nr:recombinase family protein [bacterium]
MLNYFLYARKSTDVEDKQVRSIEDQLAVLRGVSKNESLNVAEEFIEKQSAKVPGRPVFNEMLARIERGEAQGIVCWKLDRLARNPVDGGQVSWMLQRGIIQHIQTHDRSYRPTDNILLMSVEFGMANQFIIDLSSNTKRGLHEKARRGEYPGRAPIGYINDSRTKLVVVDRKRSKIVRRAFELYAEGNWRLEDAANFLAREGIKTKGGKPIKRDQVSYMLSNPFYVGLFRYAGELHEGKYQPIVSKQLFDKVQTALKARSKPPKNPTNNPQVLCGFIRCGECGMMITAEHRIKRQKNGNVHEYTYYHCSRKSKTIRCSEPPVREEELNRQLSNLLKKYALPDDWAAELLKMSERDEKEAAQSTTALAQTMRGEIQGISQKLQRLLDAYLDQDIERESYRSEKAELLSRKKSLEEKMAQVAKGLSVWIEPLRDWIKDAQMLNGIDEATPLPLKKSFAQKIFGLNLTLHARDARGVAE